MLCQISLQKHGLRFCYERDGLLDSCTDISFSTTDRGTNTWFSTIGQLLKHDYSTIGQLTLYPSSRTMGSVHSNPWTPNVTAWFLNQSFFQKQSLSYTIVKRHGQKRKFLIECHGCRPICLEWEQWTVIQLVDLEHCQLTHYPWSRTKESDAQFLI